MITSESNNSAASGRISFAEHLLILAATAVISGAVLQSTPLQSANDRSRWVTVWSLVERGTFQIDEIDADSRWSTIDKVRYRRDDSEPYHFYSSKPPLLSTIVAGLYAIERATIGFGLFHETKFVTRFLLMFVNVLPFYFALRSLSHCLRIFRASPAVRVFVLAVAGFGSMLTPYLTTLNNHTPAVMCAMFSITAAARMISRNRNESRTFRSSLDFASLGFFSALTCCFELPAAQLGVLAFVSAMLIHRRQTVCYFIPAALIPLIAFFVTNWLATGGVKPFYATYGTETYLYEHNGIPSYWLNPHGLDANSESTSVYLFHCILGHHGLLSLTPVLCVSLLGWWLTICRGRALWTAPMLSESAPQIEGTDAASGKWHGDRAQNFLILTGTVMTLITLGFYLTRTQNYNYGGNSVGLRWMLWLSPFWWIAMVPAMERFSRRSFQNLSLALLVISIASVSWSLNRPWKASWLYEQMEAGGWINYRTLPAPFDPPRTSVFDRVPDNVGVSMSWVNSQNERLIVTTVDPAIPAGMGSERPDIDIELEFADKRTPLQDLSLPETPLSPELIQAIENAAILSNTTRLKQIFSVEWLAIGARHSWAWRMPTGPGTWSGYRAAGTIWVPSKSASNKAWKVERGAARVLVDDPAFGKCWRRSDVMFCDQLPFGVLQWKTTVTSADTGEVLGTETWIYEQH